MIIDTQAPRFQPMDHQRPVINYMMNGGKRALLVWHRRAGKDLTFWNITWAKAQERVGVYYYFYPTYAQAKKAIWYGMDETGIRFLDYIPPSLIASTHDTDMRIHFTNGSILQLIGSDNIDSIMSTNPLGCVFSEYSIQDPAGWLFVIPILRKNGGWAAFVYTPRGRNHGHSLYMNNKDDPNWHVELKTIVDTGLMNPADLDEDRRAGMPEELIQQEFYCDFNISNEGSYFGTQMDQAEKAGRIRSAPHDPRHPVHTAWDFGVNDSTAIWFVQTDGRTIWAIDFLAKANNHGLPEFAQALQQRGYFYGTHLAPHDVMKREFGTGDQIMQAGANLGIHFTLVPRTDKKSQHQAAHYLIPRMVFDSITCANGIDGLKSYEREWDKSKKVFNNTPKHDWASHIADAFMTLACGVDLISDGANREISSIGAFDPRQYSSYANFDPRKATDNGNDSRSQREIYEGDARVGQWETDQLQWGQSNRSETGSRNRLFRGETS